MTQRPTLRYADSHVIPSWDETAFATLGGRLDDEAHAAAEQLVAVDADL